MSGNGGNQPRWSKDGKELFYVEGDMLIAAAVRPTPSFSLGSATPPVQRSPFGHSFWRSDLLRRLGRRPAVRFGGRRGKRGRQAAIHPCCRELVRRVPRSQAGLSPPETNYIGLIRRIPVVISPFPSNKLWPTEGPRSGSHTESRPWRYYDRMAQARRTYDTVQSKEQKKGHAAPSPEV